MARRAIHIPESVFLLHLSLFPPYLYRCEMDFQRSTILTLELVDEHRRGKRRRSKGSWVEGTLFQAGSTPSRVSVLFSVLSLPDEIALLRGRSRPRPNRTSSRKVSEIRAKSAVYPRELSDSRMNASNYSG